MSSKTLDRSEIPVLGDASAEPPQHKFVLRPLRFSDIPTLANHTVDAYDGTPVANFLAPRGYLYRNDLVRGYYQTIWRRAVDVHVLSLVACLASDPRTPLGYGQFLRLGDDHGAKRFAQSWTSGKRLLMFLLSWVIWVYFAVQNWLWPDRSCDENACNIFRESNAADKERYWTSHPERANRWHAQNIIVGPKWQGKGAGRLILSEALSRAQEEHAIMGLQASPAGEKLYRRMGFQMLGDYTYRVGGDTGGGVMIWLPEHREENFGS